MAANRAMNLNAGGGVDRSERTRPQGASETG